jgi:small-conductance mechanosensitive channel
VRPEASTRQLRAAALCAIAFTVLLLTVRARADEPKSASSASAVPAGSASAPTAPVEAPAKIHDTVVFVLRHGHAAKSAADRSRAATEALSRAVERSGSEDVKVVGQGDASVVYAGTIPVVELYPEDVELSGFSTQETYAASVAAHVHDALAEEKKRSAIAGTVFSFSLLVFVGLVAFYVLQKVGEFFHKARQWTIDNPDRITGIRIQSQEVIGPTVIRGGVMIMLVVGRFVAQMGVFYLWLVFALSLFQSTRPYTEKLTGFVVTPLSDLAERLAASLPLAVMAVVSGVAVYVLLRVVQLFFEGVARRQTVIPWLPADLATPTSVLTRISVVVVALVLIAPLVTGDPNGSLSRVGSVALLMFGLSATPLLASSVVGVLVVYGRRLRVGEHAEVGGRAGKIIGMGLVDVRLRDRDGCEIRVPHLLSLFHPTRILGLRPRLIVVLRAPVTSQVSDVRRVLLEAAASLGETPNVELSDIDAATASYRVTLAAGIDKTESDVRFALVEALSAAGVSYVPARAAS